MSELADGIAGALGFVLDVIGLIAYYTGIPVLIVAVVLIIVLGGGTLLYSRVRRSEYLMTKVSC
jgi:hypothetical protein